MDLLLVCNENVQVKLELVISFWTKHIGCIFGKGRESGGSVSVGRIGSGIYNRDRGSYGLEKWLQTISGTGIIIKKFGGCV